MNQTKPIFFSVCSALLPLFFFLGNPALAATPDTKSSSHKLVILGDSLTEGYGVAREKAFPALLENLIKEDRQLGPWQVVNAGVSGSTSASIKSRLAWQLRGQPDVLVLALGANDGLRGLDPKSTRKNIEEGILSAEKAGVTVILAGLQMPPNYGGPYRKEFAAIFADLAEKYKVPLIPFLLEGVAGDSKLNLPDGIHPNEKGYEIISRNVFKNVRPTLLKIATTKKESQ